jgi:hypothetical protein
MLRADEGCHAADANPAPSGLPGAICNGNSAGDVLKSAATCLIRDISRTERVFRASG